MWLRCWRGAGPTKKERSTPWGPPRAWGDGWEDGDEVDATFVSGKYKLDQGEGLQDFSDKTHVVSILAGGVVGAIGAFGVLLAFGAKGHPAAVMSIIFAGAPIVNAFVAMTIHPPAGGWAKLDWRFLLGILLAATGGLLVSLYKPAPSGAGPGKAPPADLTAPK